MDERTDMPGMADRVAAIQARIEAACGRAGRDPAGVNLIAVSKNHGPDKVREAAGCGLRIFGENRVQEARAKIPESPGHLEWHLIGHLQRNKAALAVELFPVIHSVDSLRLIEALETAADRAGRTVKIFFEVNVSGEASKFGFDPAQVAGALEACATCHRLEVIGLMTMPPFTTDPEGARPYFRALVEHRARWRDQTGFPLDELSMGMSHDFEVAIEEGANWVRVGTAIFGERTRGEAA